MFSLLYLAWIGRNVKSPNDRDQQKPGSCPKDAGQHPTRITGSWVYPERAALRADCEDTIPARGYGWRDGSGVRAAKCRPRRRPCRRSPAAPAPGRWPGPCRLRPATVASQVAASMWQREGRIFWHLSPSSSQSSATRNPIIRRFRPVRRDEAELWAIRRRLRPILEKSLVPTLHMRRQVYSRNRPFGSSALSRPKRNTH